LAARSAQPSRHAAGGTRVAVCTTCGSPFDTPIRRGRPPGLCQSCRAQVSAAQRQGNQQ
jgi:hypothetical protein